VARLAALFVAVLAALTACGSGARTTAETTTARAAKRCKDEAAADRAVAVLKEDVAAIRRAAQHPAKDTLKGSRDVNAATDKFLYDVATAPVDLLVKNRFIDRAASALQGTCQQCFQALEAERPIPSIAQHGPGAGCGLR
jgi:methylphosphotriester-DNA--protein-cysteine methyltransferase